MLFHIIELLHKSGVRGVCVWVFMYLMLGSAFAVENSIEGKTRYLVHCSVLASKTPIRIFWDLKKEKKLVSCPNNDVTRCKSIFKKPAMRLFKTRKCRVLV